MGLNHPQDLAAWERWQRRQRPQAFVRQLLRPPPPVEGRLLVKGSDPRIMVVLDAGTFSKRSALVAPLAHLASVAVLAPRGVDLEGFAAAGTDWREVSPKVILSAGHYLPLGAEAYAWARSRGIPFVVSQHGLLTPLAPPLPQDSTLLAWSQEDADFWIGRRRDVASQVTGSQLLWRAHSPRTLAADQPPIWLGQLHGAELPRFRMARVSMQFCLEHQGQYRPHPAEVDRLSRWQHRFWRRRGVRFADTQRPLTELDAPVVAAFSTGILEAAAGGGAAWAHWDDRPPAWLEEFWQRYRMHRWGAEEPTPRPAQPDIEPARAIASYLESVG